MVATRRHHVQILASGLRAGRVDGRTASPRRSTNGQEPLPQCMNIAVARRAASAGREDLGALLDDAFSAVRVS